MLSFLGMFVILSWMIPSALLVKNIVYEKEMRLKEMMRIMGLSDSIHWVAWSVQSFMLNFVSIFLISILLKVKYNSLLFLSIHCNCISPFGRKSVCQKQQDCTVPIIEVSISGLNHMSSTAIPGPLALGSL